MPGNPLVQLEKDMLAIYGFSYILKVNSDGMYK